MLKNLIICKMVIIMKYSNLNKTIWINTKKNLDKIKCCFSCLQVIMLNNNCNKFKLTTKENNLKLSKKKIKKLKEKWEVQRKIEEIYSLMSNSLLRLLSWKPWLILIFQIKNKCKFERTIKF